MPKTFIIAEAGVNHNGDINKALELINLASLAGADAVKFQTFNAENLTTASAPKAEYQKQNTNKEENQQDMLKKLELSKDNYLDIIGLCKLKDI